MGDDQVPFDFDKDLPHKKFSDDPPATPPHRMVRTTDPHTSFDSALLVDTKGRKKQILKVIREYKYGFIQDDILKHFPPEWYGRITPQFAVLEREGFIVSTGETRKGNSGRQQIVRIATEYYKRSSHE